MHQVHYVKGCESLGRAAEVSEIIITLANPDRVAQLADECLITIRLIENRREALKWVYEYEANGEAGKIKKFINRLKQIEIHM